MMLISPAVNTTSGPKAHVHTHAVLTHRYANPLLLFIVIDIFTLWWSGLELMVLSILLSPWICEALLQLHQINLNIGSSHGLYI
jgi:hypothetical protein